MSAADAADDMCALCRAGMPPRGGALRDAAASVYGPRDADYGHPRGNHGRIADMWRAAFGWDVKAEDVWQAMVLVKLSRERVRPRHDNRTDIAGYAETGDMLHGEG